MVAPLAPHIAEELWSRIGHHSSLAYQAFPQADPVQLNVEFVTAVIQVDGNVRDRLEVRATVTADELRALALASDTVQRILHGRPVLRVIARPPRLVNVVPE
jgi:leucyl-tRNA synthetase